MSIAEESPLLGKALSDLLSLGDGEVVASAVSLRGATLMAPFPDLTLLQEMSFCSKVVRSDRSRRVRRFAETLRKPLDKTPKDRRT